ncbi:carbon-nitrogen hydrolase family protein [candidate division KSB1 bacterium]
MKRLIFMIALSILLIGLAGGIYGQDIGRPVTVVSIGFQGKSLEAVLPLVDREGEVGADIIALPETFLGQQQNRPETLSGPTITALAALARKQKTYIVCPIDRVDGGKRLNSAVLIDRDGKVAAVYDKIYPFWTEFDLDPPVDPGEKSVVFETDFGKVGFAICFDSNFPGVWSRMADQGAELVIWPSAYSAGTQLKAHALNHHFYIVTSTLRRDCIVYDITGEEIHYQKSGDVNVSRITLDLDRCIYHVDFNVPKRQKMMEEHPGEVVLEKFWDREAWFVLRAVRPGVSARKLAAEYGLEELRHYKDRSRRQIDQKRPRPVVSGDK